MLSPSNRRVSMRTGQLQTHPVTAEGLGSNVKSTAARHGIGWDESPRLADSAAADRSLLPAGPGG
jgi:hypothetical protein